MKKDRVDSTAIKAKYSAENSMFEIRNEPAQGCTDFECISRYAPIIWAVTVLMCLIFRAV